MDELSVTLSSHIHDKSYSPSIFKNHRPLSSLQKFYDEFILGPSCGSAVTRGLATQSL